MSPMLCLINFDMTGERSREFPILNNYDEIVNGLSIPVNEMILMKSKTMCRVDEYRRV